MRYVYNNLDKLKCDACGAEIEISMQPTLDDYYMIAAESTDALVNDYFEEQGEEVGIVNFYPSEEYEVFLERENGTKIIIVVCDANGEEIYGIIEVGFGINANGNEELRSYKEKIYVASQDDEDVKNKVYEIAKSLTKSSLE